MPYLADNLQLMYALVDMAANGGYGAVTRRDQLISATTNTAHLLAVRHRNNRDFWLLTRSLSSRAFLAYALTPAGLATNPVISPPTEDTPYPKEVFANFRCSPDGSRLVTSGTQQVTVGNSYYLEGRIALYNFDNNTGQVDNERIFHKTLLQSLTNGSGDLGKYNCDLISSNCTACCFSPSGAVLYDVETIPYTFYTTSICQYDLTQPTPAAIGASRLVLVQAPAFPVLVDVNTSFRFPDLQLTPEGTIWVADMQHRSGRRSATAQLDIQPKAVSIIRHPDVVGPGCQLDLQAYPLPGRVGTPQFPNVVTNMLYPATSLEYEVSCTDSARFWANSAQSGPPGRWNFGDPASGPANEATGYYVAHRYAQGGTYQVSLTYPGGRQLVRAVAVPAGPADLTRANVFTPDGDGHNDTFAVVLRGELAAPARLRVFSR